ncbi:uncharacterized protein [Penaeus vannamei]|uniref:uncharacterized protein n=1 Tax=Penaeus vannamei TaxID=6689 RepID=UPI00387F3D80
MKEKTGNILMKDEEIKQRWKDYFTELLNNETRYQRLEEVEPVEGPIPNIEMAEVKAAIKGSKSNKGSGRSEVCVEMMKTLGAFVTGWTFELLESIWKAEKMPQDWKIILERVIDQRLRGKFNIYEYQFGFMTGRSTKDAIFIMRQVQEKFLEGNRKLYYCFVDLVQAYDRTLILFVSCRTPSGLSPLSFSVFDSHGHTDIENGTKWITGEYVKDIKNDEH